MVFLWVPIGFIWVLRGWYVLSCVRLRQKGLVVVVGQCMSCVYVHVWLCVSLCVFMCSCVYVWACGLASTWLLKLPPCFIITIPSSSPYSYQGLVHHHHSHFLITSSSWISLRPTSPSSSSLSSSVARKGLRHHHQISIIVSINISPASEFHSHFAWAPPEPQCPTPWAPLSFSPMCCSFGGSSSQTRTCTQGTRCKIRPMSAIALLCFSTAIACLSCSWAFLAKFGVLQQWRGSSTSSSSDMTAHACPFQYQ